MVEGKKRCHCQICGREMEPEEYGSYEGLCLECWEEQLDKEEPGGLPLEFP